MPDPIEPTLTDSPAVDAAAELAVLKQAHQEVLTKRQRDKAKLTELESASAALQTKLAEAEAKLHETIVTQPLTQLSKSISTVSSVWLETFNKHFRVQNTNGELTVLTSDGKPIHHANGKPLRLVESEIAKYVTETEPDSERTKLFRMITIGSKASGAGGSVTRQSSFAQETAKRGSQIGLGRKL